MAVQEIWIMEKVSQDVAISLSTPSVSNYFRQGSNSGAWLCVQTNFQVGGAILTFYRTLGNSGLCGLSLLGLPTTGEYSLHVNGHPEVVAQDFERATAVYDPAHVYDRPPGAGAVYLAHESRATVTQEQLDVMQVQLVNATGQLKSTQAALVTAQNKIEKAIGDLR